MKKNLFLVTLAVAVTLAAACEMLSPEVNGTEEDGVSGPPDEFILCGEVPDHIGEKDVWVLGYVVGGDLTSSSSMSVAPPFRLMTNLALSRSMATVEKDSCISVQLPKGTIRDSLNLVSNPDRLWKLLYVKGDIVAAYFGIPGIKNVSAYHIPE